jgi:hypothetical protein
MSVGGGRRLSQSDMLVRSLARTHFEYCADGQPRGNTCDHVEEG